MNILIEPWYQGECAGRAADMPGRVSSQMHNLEPGRPVVIEPMRHCTFIAGIEGVVWLTQEGSAADCILRPGREFRAMRRGKIVMQAIGGPARIEVMTAQ